MKTEFKFTPYNLQYFDDSDVVMMEDRERRRPYISEDAGESWKPVEEAPEGYLVEVQMHPFDNKRAYIFMHDKEHWKTKDRGKTWQKFSSDRMASAFRNALTFHAGDPDRIIFNAMECTGMFCEEIVSQPSCGENNC